MKCHILFSGKNKKNIINLSSAENAQRVVKVNNQCSLQSSSTKFAQAFQEYGTGKQLTPRSEYITFYNRVGLKYAITSTRTY